MIHFRLAAAAFAALLLLPGIAAPAQEKVIYNFTVGNTDGYFPEAGLIFDSAGNLYGTTNSGGTYLAGTVFELSPSGGGWSEGLLWNLPGGSGSPVNPDAPLLFDSLGNLYGTANGGSGGAGSVFELSPGVPWTESTIGVDSQISGGALISDSQGNLYGVSQQSVFELSPPVTAGGQWTEQTLFTFGGESTGFRPLGGLVFDSKGNLYGTTSDGGAGTLGTVFELSPPKSSSGQWTETVLWSFGNAVGDGSTPMAGLIIDSKGNLYGTCQTSVTIFSTTYGAAFELSPPATEGGKWTETVLHLFTGGAGDGSYPQSPLAMDADGNIYGTTVSGGPNYDAAIYTTGGSLFELSPPASPSGSWTEQILHFFGAAGDGFQPLSGVTFDDEGHIFGTTQSGGANSGGTVYEYTAQPTAEPPTFTPPAGTYSSAQTVEIKDATPHAVVYYTTDGTPPTTSSMKYTAAIAVSASETITAIAVASGYNNSASASSEYVIQSTSTATPMFLPVPGIYAKGQSVTLYDGTSGATIYYTTNGLPPTTSSAVYKTPIPVTKNVTILATAIAPGHSMSGEGIGAYTILSAKPVIFPPGGTYPKAQVVKITDATPGVTIHYSTTGKAANAASPIYKGPITVVASATVQAIAIGGGYGNSPSAKAKFTIEPPTATPVFSPIAGKYAKTQTVKITDKTAGAVIYYTTNGASPTIKSPKYTTDITVSASETLKAMALAKNYADSSIATAVYQIGPPTATPEITPAGGTFKTAQSVTIKEATADATIYYTTNGTTPTAKSTKYTKAFTVSASGTVKAIATAVGHTDSAVASEKFTIN